jgi:hypothetical protein
MLSRYPTAAVLARAADADLHGIAYLQP